MKSNLHRPLCFVTLLVSSLVATASVKRIPMPNAGINRGSSILVLDNCDPKYKGKEEYSDNLTLVDRRGEKKFRLSGFNNCEAIGSAHMIATDAKRQCIWVIENVGHRIRRFDSRGRVTLTIPKIKGSAIAVDPENGNLWVLASKGGIGRGQTLVYDPVGKKVAAYDVTGWDIAYDRKSKAFWIVDRNITKISAAKGQIAFTKKICVWCASSVEIDPRSGNAWVAIRKHGGVAGSRNRLLKIDPNGKELQAIELENKVPFRVSANSRDGSVWVAHKGTAIERFSAMGNSTVTLPVKALAVQVDPNGHVWAVTRTGLQLLTPTGEVLKRVPHKGETSQAWIGLME